MAITIYDVAKAAGVGVGTVSRVINNSQSVKETTRTRVLEAISRLNYRPDPIARSMTMGHTGSLGVIVPFFTRPFSIEVLRGIGSAAARLGYELVIYNVETNHQRDDYFTRLPMRRKVDGLLIISLSPDPEVIPGLQKADLPTVLVDAYNPLLTSLVVNNVEGAYNAVKYLIGLGHQHIGFINGIIEGNFKFNQANDRLIGVHRALGEAGIQFEPDLMAISEWNRAGGQGAARQLLGLKNRPSAIFASSDMQALGVIEVARELGLAVPHELSIVGFDGVELSEYFELTTIQQPMQQMGELGVEKLLEMMQDHSRPPELIRLDTRLVERKTTGLVAGSITRAV